jgi:hypothetical protein
MQLITNLLVGLGMAELVLVDYFVMGEAIGIVATLFASFYYSHRSNIGPLTLM